MEDTKTSRIRFTDEEKRAIVQRCKESGLSKNKFAAQNNIKYYTLVSWFEKERNEATAKSGQSFLQVAAPVQEGVFAELKTEHGITLRFFKSVEPSYFQTLLKK